MPSPKIIRSPKKQLSMSNELTADNRPYFKEYRIQVGVDTEYATDLYLPSAEAGMSWMLAWAADQYYTNVKSIPEIFNANEMILMVRSVRGLSTPNPQLLDKESIIKEIGTGFERQGLARIQVLADVDRVRLFNKIRQLNSGKLMCLSLMIRGKWQCNRRYATTTPVDYVKGLGFR